MHGNAWRHSFQLRYLMQQLSMSTTQHGPQMGIYMHAKKYSKRFESYSDIIILITDALRSRQRHTS